MQTVFAEKTEDRSLDDNRHIGELFFIRMYWEKGRIPSGNILYWKDAKREDAQINFTGFDGLLLYLDETCEQNGVLLRQVADRVEQGPGQVQPVAHRGAAVGATGRRRGPRALGRLTAGCRRFGLSHRQAESISTANRRRIPTRRSIRANALDSQPRRFFGDMRA